MLVKAENGEIWKNSNYECSKLVVMISQNFDSIIFSDNLIMLQNAFALLMPC